MRRVLDRFKGDRQWWGILAICLSLAAVFLAWVLSHREPEPAVIADELPGTSAEPDAGQPDHLVLPEDDGLRIFKVNEATPAGLPSGVTTTADQTVAVHVTDGEGTWYGSGFVQRKGLVVSAAHIFDHVAEPYAPMVFCGGSDVEGKVLAIDRGRDIVLIEAACDGVMRRLDLKPLKTGEPLYLAGYTYSFPGDGDVAADRYVRTVASVKSAKLTDLPSTCCCKDITDQLAEMKKRNLARHQAVTSVAIPGHSGSAVTRPDGSIVGVVVIRDPARGRSFIIPARHIAQLKKKFGIP